MLNFNGDFDYESFKSDRIANGYEPSGFANFVGLEPSVILSRLRSGSDFMSAYPSKRHADISEYTAGDCEPQANEDSDFENEVGLLFDGRQIVIVCFGTTAISGDSLGPIVGSLLKGKYNLPAFVYGTEDVSVNGKNMGEWLDFIRSVHEDAVFISIDASLGAKDRVGQIVLRKDGVCPAAIKGKNTRFGDVGILGVVAENTNDPLMQLMTVSPLYVEKMADKIANMIFNAISSSFANRV